MPPTGIRFQNPSLHGSATQGECHQRRVHPKVALYYSVPRQQANKSRRISSSRLDSPASLAIIRSSWLSHGEALRSYLCRETWASKISASQTACAPSNALDSRVADPGLGLAFARHRVGNRKRALSPSEISFRRANVPSFSARSGRIKGSATWPALCARRRSEIVEMAVPPGNRAAVPRDSELKRTILVRRKVSLSCLSRPRRGEPVCRRKTRRRPEGRPYPRSQQVVRA
jgi:hypothetical protein